MMSHRLPPHNLAWHANEKRNLTERRFGNCPSVPPLSSTLAVLRDESHATCADPNVSNFVESLTWFEKLGWTMGWDRGDPPTFGVASVKCEIFLCEHGRGGRGQADKKMTFGPEGEDSADKGGLDVGLGG